MNVDRMRNNTEFYNGFEYEPEIELKIAEKPDISIHIWDGYFCDIFSNPDFHENGWTGFTRDFQEEVRTYDSKETRIDVSEYLSDLMTYRYNQFEITKTNKCLELMCEFLKYADENNYTVLVTWWS